MCFRILDGSRWTTTSHQVIVAVTRADEPPYADILLAQLTYMRTAHLCEYCACFLKERTERGETCRVRPGRRHGMQIAVEYLLSGGSHRGPSRPHLDRCLRILSREDHPFLATKDDALRDRLRARSAVCNEDCIVRWLLEGRQTVFSDAYLAKRVRRWMYGQRRSHRRRRPTGPWDMPLPDACRFCANNTDRLPHSSLPLTYSGALIFGNTQRMECALRAMEEEETATAHGTIFVCVRCRRRTAVAYEYHVAMWPKLGLAVFPSPDAYYGRLVMLARNRMEKIKRRAAAKALCALEG